MSGLKLVPRMPKCPSTMKGNEAAARAMSATGAPTRSAGPAPLHPSPEVDHRSDDQSQDGDRGQDPVPGQPHGPPANGAEQRQTNGGRKPGPLPPPSKAQSPPGRLPMKRRTPPARLHRSRSRNGRNWARTSDLRLVEAALSQLSYTPGPPESSSEQARDDACRIPGSRAQECFLSLSLQEPMQLVQLSRKRSVYLSTVAKASGARTS